MRIQLNFGSSLYHVTSTLIHPSVKSIHIFSLFCVLYLSGSHIFLLFFPVAHRFFLSILYQLVYCPNKLLRKLWKTCLFENNGVKQIRLKKLSICELLGGLGLIQIFPLMCSHCSQVQCSCASPYGAAPGPSRCPVCRLAGLG